MKKRKPTQNAFTFILLPSRYEYRYIITILSNSGGLVGYVQIPICIPKTLEDKNLTYNTVYPFKIKLFRSHILIKYVVLLYWCH